MNAQLKQYARDLVAFCRQSKVPLIEGAAQTQWTVIDNTHAWSKSRVSAIYALTLLAEKVCRNLDQLPAPRWQGGECKSYWVTPGRECRSLLW